MNPAKNLILSLFQKITLKRRLLLTYSLLSSLILLITSVAFYNSSKKILIDRATKSSRQQLELITNNLGEKIDHISDYAVTLSISSSIANILKENPTVPDKEIKRFWANTELTNQAQRIIGLHKNIYAWDILDTENHWFHSSTTETEDVFPFLACELDNLKRNLSFQFLGPFPVNGEPVFVALKSITDIDNTKYLGALVLLIRETNISASFHNLPDDDLKNFFIVDEDNRILSSSTSEGIYSSFGDYTGISPDDLALFEKKDCQVASVNGVETLLIRKEYAPLNWHIINLIPLESLTIEHVMILKNIIIISVILLLLSFVFSILCTKTVTSPIQRLASKMEAASQGNLNITADYYSWDELAVLYDQFNLMMQKIQALLQNIYEEQNAKQKMEIQLLQSQINPHFLYNTLNTIKSLIELDMPETAGKAVASMSSFYRNLLSRGQFIIPLKDELLLTEQYLYIQNLRFMEFVDYEIICDKSCREWNIRVPKLTLQPVVENVFVHALAHNRCHIRLQIQCMPDSIMISVEDNGKGIPPDKLSALKKSIGQNITSQKSIGLPSIHHRIVLLYGKDYGLSIASQEGIGTAVTIKLPKGGNEIENTGDY